ncbi:MAG: rhomboid family intramembrane serine protease [Candidatus Caldarchaeales archaeon]
MYIERSRNAYLTWTIIFINVIIFLLVNLNPTLVLYLGAIPIYTILLREPYRLITSMFTHYDPVHLLFNMFALFIFGPDIERTVGKTKYLVLYFISGLIAAFFHAYYVYIFFPIRTLLTTPAIGASGAIYGIMAAYGVLFPLRRLVAFIGFPIMAPAIIVIIILALIQTLYAFVAPFSQVAYAAHVGGFVAGLIITIFYRPGLKRPTITPYF